MHKQITVDMNNLTTKADIVTYLQESLSEFSHLFTTSVDSNNYLWIYPLDCNYCVQIRHNIKGSTTYFYYYTYGTTNYHQADSCNINSSYTIDIFTNEDNNTFAIFFYSNYYHRFCVTKGTNGIKYLLYGYTNGDNCIKADTGYYGASTVFYCQGYGNIDKCFLFNLMRKSNYKLYDPPMIDTFNAALPVRLNVRNTCTIDGEKYVVFDNGTSNNYCEAILFKYTE